MKYFSSAPILPILVYAMCRLYMGDQLCWAEPSEEVGSVSHFNTWSKKYIFLGVDRVGHLPAWTSVHWWKHFLLSQDLLHPHHQAESSTRQWTNQLQEGCQSLFSSCSTVWITMASDILQVKYINPSIFVKHHVLSSMCDLPH